MSLKLIVYIYFMFDLRTKHGYVGKSIYPEDRIKGHWEYRNKKADYKNHWLCTLSSPPESEILKECTQKNWKKWEIYFIAKMKEEGWTLTNLTDGGDEVSSKGYKFSEEAKEKMRIRMLGNKFNTGRGSLTKDHRIKISLSLIGNKRSLGNKQSEKQKCEMSIRMKGNQHLLGWRFPNGKKNRGVAPSA